MRKYKNNKIVALLLILCFGASLPFSAPAVHAYGGVEAQTPHSLQKNANSLASLNLPREFGSIEVRHKFSGGDHRPIVILIQDAHAIGQAQKSIQKILRHLSEHYGISLVGLEGASVPFDPLFLKNFPDPSKREEILNQYVEKGEISGAVAAALLSDAPTEYRGMENQQLYEEGIDLFLTSLTEISASQDKLKIFQEKIASLKKRNYNQQLLELDDFEKRLENPEENPKILKALLKKQEKDIQKYPHLAMLFKEMELEESPEEAAKQLLSFGKELEKKITDRGARILLNEKTQAFQTQQISASAFAQALTGPASQQGLKIPEAVTLLAGNAHAIQKFRGEKVQEELEALFEDLREQAFENDRQRVIYKQDRQLKLFEKLVELKLTRKEWEKLSPSPLPSLPSRGRGVHPKMKGEGAMVARSFYQNAEAREEALYQNLRRRMKEKKINAAAMVIGGFHARGFIECLKKDRISYALISPAIQSIDKDEKYLDYMQGRVSWKNYFREENGRIHLAEAFSRAVRDQLLQTSDQRQAAVVQRQRALVSGRLSPVVVKLWRDELIWSLAHQNRLSEAKRYTHFLDEISQRVEQGHVQRSGPVPYRVQWQARVERFIQDLKVLRTHNELTPAGISKILGQPFSGMSTTQFWSAVPAGNVPALWAASKPRPHAMRTRTIGPLRISAQREAPTTKTSAGKRSEVRRQAEENLLFGVHERNPDWWIMRTIGSAMLDIRSHQPEPKPISFYDISSKVRTKLRAHGFKEEKTLSNQHLQGLLKRMHDPNIDLVTIRDGKYDFAQDLRYFALKVHDLYYIHSEFNQALADYQNAVASSKALDTVNEALVTVLEAYATATGFWHKYSVEARWPVLKAVSILDKDKQQSLLEFLQSKQRAYLLKRPLLDSISQLLSNKAPEKWLEKHAANLKGSLILYISPETWLAAGGLGRVGQYHTVKAKELMGQDADLVTIEPYYSKYDTAAGQMIPIDYSKVPVPVENLQHVTELDFSLRASRRGQRADVIVEVYRGVNRHGIGVYLFKDRPAEGKVHSYFVNELYNYEDPRKSLPYESATKEEFAEFFGKAVLKLSKRIKFQKEQTKGGEPIYSLLWANDGQSAMLPVFKRISDQIEKLTLEQKEKIRTQPDIKWKDLFGGNEEIPMSEFKDLINEDRLESSLSEADTHQTGHTYRNQGFGDFNNDYVLNNLPYAWRRYFKSTVYEGLSNYTRAGMLAADSTNGVSAIHAQEISWDTTDNLIGITNGDDREASRSFFEAVAKEIYGDGVETDFLNAEQVLKIHATAKRKIASDPDFLKLDPEFANLRSDRPVLSISARGVEEKLDYKKVFSRHNIERLITEEGAQIILFANIQADPEGKSQKMFDELKKIQMEINNSEEAKRSGGRLIVVSGWGIPEQRKLFAITDAAVYVSARDPLWGTEAAGFTEADYALNGGVIITSTYLEAIFQQQGFMIDWTKPGMDDKLGIGNTVIPEGDESKHYLDAMMQVVKEWNQDPLRFASYQAASIRYSRSLDARFTAGEYLRQFSRLRSRRQNPLELLKRTAVNGDREGEFFQNRWLRADLLQQIQKLPHDQFFELERKPDSNLNIRSFAIKLDGAWYLVAMHAGQRYEQESAGTRFVNGDNNTLENLLNNQDIPLAGAQVRVLDAMTGREYKIYSVGQLLKEGLPIDIPEDFQVLRLEQVMPESEEEIRVDRKGLFESNIWNAAVRASLLNLIPDKLWKHLSEEGYDTEHILWQVQGRAPMEAESSDKKPLYAIVEKGKGGIVLTLTPSTQGLTDLRAQIQSVFNGIDNGNGAFKAFAHIHLEAQGDTVFVGTGKINMSLEEPIEHGVFKKWFREDLMPWAQELGFKKIRIEQTRLSDEVLQEIGFLPTTTERVFEFALELVETEGKEGAEHFTIPDAAAKRFLDFSGRPFVWKSDHTTELLKTPKPGFLGWIFDFASLELEGRAREAVRFHNANTTGLSVLGDVWGYMDSFLKTVRSLESLKSKLETLKRDYEGEPSEDVKTQKTLEAMDVLKDFVKALAWKIFRDYVAGKEYARQALNDPAKAPVLRALIESHLQQLIQTQNVESWQVSEKVSVFSVPMPLIYTGEILDRNQRVLVAINRDTNAQQIKISADQIKHYLEQLPGQDERGILQAVDLAERTRLGGGTGETGEVLELESLKTQGYSTEVPGVPLGIRTLFFESGEAQHLIDLIKIAVRTDTEEHAEKIQKELEYQQSHGNLEKILKAISLIGKDKAVKEFGEENLPPVMALIAGLSLKRLNAMKDWHPQTFLELSKAFSRKNDREIYEKGAVYFHRASSNSALVFSKTYQNRSLYFPIYFRKIRDEEEIRDSKKMFFLRDIENLKLIEKKNYQIRSKITRRLYSHLHHLDSMRAEGGWRIRIPKDSRYQILEIKPEEVKAPGVRHKFNNFVIAVNISDLGIEVQRDGKTVAAVRSFEKLKEILEELAQLGPSEIYIYGGVFKMSRSSKQVHSDHGENINFLPGEDHGVTLQVQKYDPKSLDYVSDQGEQVKVPDDAGNPFSIIRDEKGVPLLNPALFVSSDKQTEKERQADYRKQFKEFNEYAASLGLGVFYDHVFWYSPEDVTGENYRDFFYRLPALDDQKRYQAIEAERKHYRDFILKAELEAIGASPAADYLDKLSQLVFSGKKQAHMDSLVASNPGFFARRIQEKNEERVVLIHHFNNENIDQALPNPFSPRIREEQLNYIKFLIDHSATGVRSDLPGKLLSYGNAGWLGEYYTRPGMQYSAPFDVDDEFWRWLIMEAKRYARRTRKNYDPKYDGFGFAMEAYGDEERENLAKAGADRLYFKEIADDYHALVGGASPEKLNADLQRAFQHHTNEWLKLLVFAANYDEKSFEAVGGVKHIQAVLGLMAAAGVPVMMDLRDLVDVGAMRTIPGGKDRFTKVISHTLSTPEQAKMRDTWGKYKAAILNGSGFKLLKKLNEAIGVKGQRYFKTIIHSDHTVSGLAIQEPETGNWTMALGHHRLGSEGTKEAEIQLPDEMFHDGTKVLDEKQDLKFTDVETGEPLSVENKKIKIAFSPGPNSAKLIRVESVLRSETRSSMEKVVSAMRAQWGFGSETQALLLRLLDPNQIPERGYIRSLESLGKTVGKYAVVDHSFRNYRRRKISAINRLRKNVLSSFEKVVIVEPAIYQKYTEQLKRIKPWWRPLSNNEISLLVLGALLKNGEIHTIRLVLKPFLDSFSWPDHLPQQISTGVPGQEYGQELAKIKRLAAPFMKEAEDQDFWLRQALRSYDSAAHAIAPHRVYELLGDAVLEMMMKRFLHSKWSGRKNMAMLWHIQLKQLTQNQSLQKIMLAGLKQVQSGAEDHPGNADLLETLAGVVFASYGEDTNAGLQKASEWMQSLVRIYLASPEPDKALTEILTAFTHYRFTIPRSEVRNFPVRELEGWLNQWAVSKQKKGVAYTVDFRRTDLVPNPSEQDAEQNYQIGFFENEKWVGDFFVTYYPSMKEFPWQDYQGYGISQKLFPSDSPLLFIQNYSWHTPKEKKEALALISLFLMKHWPGHVLIHRHRKSDLSKILDQINAVDRIQVKEQAVLGIARPDLLQSLDLVERQEALLASAASRPRKIQTEDKLQAEIENFLKRFQEKLRLAHIWEQYVGHENDMPRGMNELLQSMSDVEIDNLRIPDFKQPFAAWLSELPQNSRAHLENEVIPQLFKREAEYITRIAEASPVALGAYSNEMLAAAQFFEAYDSFSKRTSRAYQGSSYDHVLERIEDNRVPRSEARDLQIPGLVLGKSKIRGNRDLFGITRDDVFYSRDRTSTKHLREWQYPQSPSRQTQPFEPWLTPFLGVGGSLGHIASATNNNNTRTAATRSLISTGTSGDSHKVTMAAPNSNLAKSNSKFDNLSRRYGSNIGGITTKSQNNVKIKNQEKYDEKEYPPRAEVWYEVRGIKSPRPFRDGDQSVGRLRGEGLLREQRQRVFLAPFAGGLIPYFSGLIQDHLQPERQPEHLWGFGIPIQDEPRHTLKTLSRVPGFSRNTFDRSWFHFLQILIPVVLPVSLEIGLRKVQRFIKSLQEEGRFVNRPMGMHLVAVGKAVSRIITHNRMPPPRNQDFDLNDKRRDLVPQARVLMPPAHIRGEQSQKGNFSRKHDILSRLYDANTAHIQPQNPEGVKIKNQLKYDEKGYKNTRSEVRIVAMDRVAQKLAPFYRAKGWEVNYRGSDEDLKSFLVKKPKGSKIKTWSGTLTLEGDMFILTDMEDPDKDYDSYVEITFSPHGSEIVQRVKKGSYRKFIYGQQPLRSLARDAKGFLYALVDQDFLDRYHGGSNTGQIKPALADLPVHILSESDPKVKKLEIITRIKSPARLESKNSQPQEMTETVKEIRTFLEELTEERTRHNPQVLKRLRLLAEVLAQYIAPLGREPLTALEESVFAGHLKKSELPKSFALFEKIRRLPEMAYRSPLKRQIVFEEASRALSQSKNSDLAGIFVYILHQIARDASEEGPDKEFNVAVAIQPLLEQAMRQTGRDLFEAIADTLGNLRIINDAQFEAELSRFVLSGKASRLKVRSRRAAYYQDAETILNRKMPTLLQVLQDPEKTARFLTVLSLSRKIFPYDFINDKPISSVAFAEKEEMFFRLGELRIAPVSESFRRHILYTKDADGKIFAIEIKIPGEQKDKDKIGRIHFTLAKKMWDLYGVGSHVAKPLFFHSLQGGPFYLYGRKLRFDDYPLGIAGFIYRDGKRLKNIYGYGYVMPHVQNKIPGYLRKIARKNGISVKKLVDNFIVDIVVFAIRVHHLGYRGNTKDLKDNHGENVRLAEEGGAAELVGDFGAFEKKKLATAEDYRDELSYGLLEFVWGLQPRVKRLMPQILEKVFDGTSSTTEAKAMMLTAAKELEQFGISFRSEVRAKAEQGLKEFFKELRSKRVLIIENLLPLDRRIHDGGRHSDNALALRRQLLQLSRESGFLLLSESVLIATSLQEAKAMLQSKRKGKKASRVKLIIDNKPKSIADWSGLGPSLSETFYLLSRKSSLSWRPVFTPDNLEESLKAMLQYPAQKLSKPKPSGFSPLEQKVLDFLQKHRGFHTAEEVLKGLPPKAAGEPPTKTDTVRSVLNKLRQMGKVHEGKKKITSLASAVSFADGSREERFREREVKAFRRAEVRSEKWPDWLAPDQQGILNRFMAAFPETDEDQKEKERTKAALLSAFENHRGKVFHLLEPNFGFPSGRHDEADIFIKEFGRFSDDGMARTVHLVSGLPRAQDRINLLSYLSRVANSENDEQIWINAASTFFEIIAKARLQKLGAAVWNRKTKQFTIARSELRSGQDPSPSKRSWPPMRDQRHSQGAASRPQSQFSREIKKEQTAKQWGRFQADKIQILLDQARLGKADQKRFSLPPLSDLKTSRRTITSLIVRRYLDALRRRLVLSEDLRSKVVEAFGGVEPYEALDAEKMQEAIHATGGNFIRLVDLLMEQFQYDTRKDYHKRSLRTNDIRVLKTGRPPHPLDFEEAVASLKAAVEEEGRVPWRMIANALKKALRMPLPRSEIREARLAQRAARAEARATNENEMAFETRIQSLRWKEERKLGGAVERWDENKNLVIELQDDLERGKIKWKDVAGSERFQRIVILSGELGLDSRPIEHSLLNPLYVGHAMEVRSKVNPNPYADQIAIYGGSGADISKYLLTINAQTAYFLDTSVMEMSDLEQALSQWDSVENFLKGPSFLGTGFSMQAHIRRKWMLGYGASSTFNFGSEPYKIMVELKAMGVKKDSVVIGKHPDLVVFRRGDNARRLKPPFIQFRWSATGQPADEKTYTIYFVPIDLRKPHLYPDIVKALNSKADFYFQSAANNLAREGELYIPAMASLVKPDGLFVVDSHDFVDPQADVMKFRYFDLEPYLAKAAIPVKQLSGIKSPWTYEEAVNRLRQTNKQQNLVNDKNYWRYAWFYTIHQIQPRAEVRRSETNKVAGNILTAMAGMVPVERADINVLAAQARKNWDGVVMELKREADDPKYAAMWEETVTQPERFLQAHPDYQNRLSVAVDELIDQIQKNAEDYLSANPRGNLNYAFAISLVNSAPEARAQLVKYFEMIQALRAKHPDANIEADFRILLTSKQRREMTPSPLPSPPFRGRGEHPRMQGEGVFQDFVKFQRTGTVKFIEADQPGVGIQLEQFLRENPNALVYSSPSLILPHFMGEEIGGGFAHRYVESQVGLDAELPVAFILSDDLSQDQTHLQAELLRQLPGRIARLHGSIIWNGRRLEVTIDALALVYQDYLSAAHIATQA